ncbi:large-conductance mechanosensitive channel protein MscL [Telluribacter sp.]|jgi:large conductance mechanosensitive channel|uniref:large-conductance mechanosensitive channel protein MscL n=1 Tax=Telluribacter sp. TaxID=1978767 RepID=UPI002E15952F|nr:large-conductance mechanosensitive channel protein MscL [Telluribacter sp.]
MLGEFKAFISRGNVLELAIGIIIGVAFAKITTSLVEDIINPILGLLIGGIDFQNLKIVLKEAAGDVPEVAIRYGNFIQVVIQFLIVAWVIFMVVKVSNRIQLVKDPEKKP